MTGRVLQAIARQRPKRLYLASAFARFRAWLGKAMIRKPGQGGAGSCGAGRRGQAIAGQTVSGQAVAAIRRLLRQELSWPRRVNWLAQWRNFGDWHRHKRRMSEA